MTEFVSHIFFAERIQYGNYENPDEIDYTQGISVVGQFISCKGGLVKNHQRQSSPKTTK